MLIHWCRCHSAQNPSRARREVDLSSIGPQYRFRSVPFHSVFLNVFRLRSLHDMTVGILRSGAYLKLKHISALIFSLILKICVIPACEWMRAVIHGSLANSYTGTLMSLARDTAYIYREIVPLCISYSTSSWRGL